MKEIVHAYRIGDKVMHKRMMIVGTVIGLTALNDEPAVRVRRDPESIWPGYGHYTQWMEKFCEKA